MELAGLSVAEAVYAAVPPSAQVGRRKILLVCGPGNNGGDGLVAARHLVMFGYECVVVYPKRSKKDHFINLIRQCEDVGIEVLDAMPPGVVEGEYDAIVDAIFGFSFKGEPREPFATALKEMTAAQGTGGDGDKEGTSIISVDIPSGWNVDEGDVAGTGFMPDVLISLTTPKLSAKSFTGRHFVGGRFLPEKLSLKYEVKMPPYPGVSQVMEVEKVDDWQAQYAEYLGEKEAKEFAENETKPLEKADGEEWAIDYYNYLAEKEKSVKEERS